MKRTLQVRECMSRLPVELLESESLREALEQMEKAGIRHIPVMKGIKLHGIIARRDIETARGQFGDDALDHTIESACSHDLLEVPPTATIPEVTQAMLERKVGSALVVDGDIIVGIFTTTDALRLLANL
ncbi:MAG: CBS domain-containing protein [Myxococcota bacterium]|nr:CBS domain-containing protein [Myxococcota bacterium]